MIENIDRLSPDDKLYMIDNMKSFSLPTISTINFNREKWLEEIELKLHPDATKKLRIQYNATCDISAISYVTRGKISNNYIEDIVTKLISEIVDMSCETKENIIDIISMFGHIIKIIKDNIPYEKEYTKDLIKYFFFRLLPFKLRAHEILVKTTTDNIPNDKILQEFYLKTLSWIIQEMSYNKSSYEKMSLLIYLICKYLDLKIKSSQLKILVESMSILYNYEFEDLMNKTVLLLKESVDSLTIINSINDDEISLMSNTLITNGKRQIENNYEKNKVSSRINNGGLCVGDNVFDDDINVSRLLIELDMLSEDRLKDYIGENRCTSFSIPENDIGYLKSEEKLPICKVLTKENGFYTLTRYENKSYLLFKTMGDSKCYGISFPSEFGGKRKVVVFDVPTNYEYVLSM